jgi:hypothetical protein
VIRSKYDRGEAARQNSGESAGSPYVRVIPQLIRDRLPTVDITASSCRQPSSAPPRRSRRHQRKCPIARCRPRGLVEIDAFDATLAAPAVGSGGGYYEGALNECFAALRDGVRSGITPVGWGCSASVLVLMSGVALELRRSHDHLASVAKFAMVAPMFFARLHRCHHRRPGIDRGAVRDHAAGWYGVPSGNSWTPSSWQPGG